MERTMRFNPIERKIEPKYTIKEILADGWDNFVMAMEEKGVTIRQVIHEEAQKIIDCQNFIKAMPNTYVRSVII
jgi:hypothetical protein